MFVQVGKRYINMANVAHILIQENVDGSHVYRFTFIWDTSLDYRTSDVGEITAIAWAIASMGRDFSNDRGE